MLEQLNQVLKEQLTGKNINQKKINRKTRPIFIFLNWSKFSELNRFFVLSFEDEAQRTSYKRYCFPNVEIKNYIVMTDRQNVHDQPARNNLKTYDSIRNIALGQGDDCTTSCSLNYNYLGN